MNDQIQTEQGSICAYVAHQQKKGNSHLILLFPSDCVKTNKMELFFHKLAG